MKARFIHHNSHVYDKEKTIKWYEEALWMHVVEEKGPEDGSWTITFMQNDASDFQVELTWNRGFDGVYENGGKDVHMAFRVEDFEAAKKHHEQMGCIVEVNEKMGLYFIKDPDGIWIEILPEK